MSVFSPTLNFGLPPGPVADPTGNLTPIWRSFLLNLQTRTGGPVVNNAPASVLSIQSDGIPQFSPLASGQVNGALGPQQPGLFYASPTGEEGTASFREIASTDLDGLEGQYPGTDTDDNADAGNIGEYISASGSAVALTSGDAANVASIVLTPGDWDVWGNFVTVPAGSTTQSNIQAWLSIVSATDPSPPNEGAYTQHQGSIGAGLRVTFPVGMMRISTAAQTTVYLSGLVTFATSTLTAGGFLAARRRR